MAGSFIIEFKKFIMRGNVMDMAVGIILGGAFGKIVSSLVADIIMPPIGVLCGGINFAEWTITLKEAVIQAGEIAKPSVTLNIGNFIQTVIDFMIIAASIFLMVKAINYVSKKKETQQEPEAAPTKQEELLSEIRDLLKK